MTVFTDATFWKFPYLVSFLASELQFNSIDLWSVWLGSEKSSVYERILILGECWVNGILSSLRCSALSVEECFCLSDWVFFVWLGAFSVSQHEGLPSATRW